MKTSQKGIILSIVILLVFSLTVCSGEDIKEAKIEGRWYTQSQVNSGKGIFKKNCAVCHGENAEKTINWKRRLPDGSLPPPPLNGKAHAWHHPLKILLQTIENGGKPFGGKMPPFKNKLSQEEKLAAITYFQNFWNKKTYEGWESRNR